MSVRISDPSSPASTLEHPSRFALIVTANLVLLAVWTGAVIWRAWAADDAFITLRVVDNALNGYGLRWNVIERVQAFTHPLWMFAILAATWVMGSAYYATMWLSIVVSAAAAAIVLLGVTRDLFSSAMAIVLMLCSLAFLDFSTSGLENPLTHLLLAVFVLLWTGLDRGARKTFWLAFVTALLMLNRIDAGLLVMPALAASAWQRPWRPHLVAGIAGFIPLMAWVAFSVIYYGFPVPNTAFAKLGTDVPQTRLVMQGVYYFGNSLWWDKFTLLTVAAALIVVAQRSGRWMWPLAAGIVLHFLYLLRIGGDFMFGRFFSAPFFVGLLILCLFGFPRRALARTAMVAVIVIGRLVLAPPPAATMGHGINDQRLVYADGTRLVHQDTLPVERRSSSLRGLALKEQGPLVVSEGVIGMTGFYAGPDVHIVDVFALADPLLARRPADPRSRIGHFERRIPAGYMESIRQGRNVIALKPLAAFYDDLLLVTQGPLWTWERWQAIVRLNFVKRTI